jgi:hypothetical protein
MLDSGAHARKRRLTEDVRDYSIGVSLPIRFDTPVF